jgi:hypothetical protein
LACFLFYVILGLLWMAGLWAYRRGCFDRLKLRRKSAASATGDPLPVHRTDKPSDGGKAPAKSRVKSIDVFRGSESFNFLLNTLMTCWGRINFT